jgi:predicted RNase H-like HicB family nuclease
MFFAFSLGLEVKDNTMKKIIKAEIYHDGQLYCARCLDFDVFRQGKTLDETAANLKEALELHFGAIQCYP